MLLNWGITSLQQSEETWTQPTLNGWGNYGGDSFGIKIDSSSWWDSHIGTTFAPWKAFDKDSNTSYIQGGRTYWYIWFYNPIPIKVKSITTNTSTADGLTLGYSNIDGDFINCLADTGHYGNSFKTSVDVPGFYNYYQLLYTNCNSSQVQFTEINIEAVYSIESNNVIIFPQAYKQNYSFILGFQGGMSETVYVDSKTLSGVTLNASIFNGIGNYITIGY